jgi:PAS domain-containing protein
VREFDPWDLVETVREGLLVLDSDLVIRFANRSFYETFAVAPADAVGRKLYELGNGQWDNPNSAPRSKLSFLVENHRATWELDRFFPVNRSVRNGAHNKGTIVCLTLPSREASFELRA